MMKVTADILWAWLLGYVICSVSGNVLPQDGSQQRDPAVLSSLNKILVFGGYECPANSHPWMAVIFSKNKVQCGGVLVHPQWVLSAAHCSRSSYTIGLGLHNVGLRGQQGTKIVRANFSLSYPQYHPLLVHHDLMLIKLKKPVVESDTIRPISVASQCAVPGTRCLFSGWGWIRNDTQAQFLQCMDTTVVSRKTCRQAYPSMFFRRLLCAGGERWNKGTCKGDSGGPLVCDGVLQGINIGSKKPCGQMGAQDVYVKICKYKKWIEKVIRTQ